MPIRIIDGDEPCAVLERNCIAEDADKLLEWLRFAVEPLVDLGECSHLHTAVLQLLIAAKVRARALPPEPILAGCLAACGIREDAATGRYKIEPEAEVQS